MMDPKLKADWIAALRGGKYNKTIDQLHTRNKSFCCLGVLCEVAGIPMTADGFNCQESDGYDEIENAVGHVGLVWKLSRLNDSGSSFDDIANIIEASLEC